MERYLAKEYTEQLKQEFKNDKNLKIKMSSNILVTGNYAVEIIKTSGAYKIKPLLVDFVQKYKLYLGVKDEYIGEHYLVDNKQLSDEFTW